MGSKIDAQSEAAEKAVRDIRRATRRHFSAEDKVRIVIAGLRGEDSVAELCLVQGAPHRQRRQLDQPDDLQLLVRGVPHVSDSQSASTLFLSRRFSIISSANSSLSCWLSARNPLTSSLVASRAVSPASRLLGRLPQTVMTEVSEKLHRVGDLQLLERWTQPTALNFAHAKLTIFPISPHNFRRRRHLLEEPRGPPPGPAQVFCFRISPAKRTQGTTRRRMLLSLAVELRRAAQALVRELEPGLTLISPVAASTLNLPSIEARSALLTRSLSAVSASITLCRVGLGC